MGIRRLVADMSRHGGCSAACLDRLQQVARQFRNCAKFRVEADGCLRIRRSDAHLHSDVGAGHIEELLELGRMVDHEIPDPIIAVGGQDRRPRLDRVVVGAMRAPQCLPRKLHLRNRCGVKGADATLDQPLEYERVRIGLHRIEHLTRKPRDEFPCRFAQAFRIEAKYWRI